MNNGRGAIMAINRNASKLAMRSTLFQVKNLAERGCCARAVQVILPTPRKHAGRLRAPDPQPPRLHTRGLLLDATAGRADDNGWEGRARIGVGRGEGTCELQTGALEGDVCFNTPVLVHSSTPEQHNRCQPLRVWKGFFLRRSAGWCSTSNDQVKRATTGRRSVQIAT